MLQMLNARWKNHEPATMKTPPLWPQALRIHRRMCGGAHELTNVCSRRRVQRRR
jgi:hypothetical protein